jgi:hypothetical protein
LSNRRSNDPTIQQTNYRDHAVVGLSQTTTVIVIIIILVAVIVAVILSSPVTVNCSYINDISGRLYCTNDYWTVSQPMAVAVGGHDDDEDEEEMMGSTVQYSTVLTVLCRHCYSTSLASSVALLRTVQVLPLHYIVVLQVDTVQNCTVLCKKQYCAVQHNVP